MTFDERETLAMIQTVTGIPITGTAIEDLGGAVGEGAAAGVAAWYLGRSFLFSRTALERARMHPLPIFLHEVAHVIEDRFDICEPVAFGTLTPAQVAEAALSSPPADDDAVFRTHTLSWAVVLCVLRHRFVWKYDWILGVDECFGYPSLPGHKLHIHLLRSGYYDRHHDRPLDRLPLPKRAATIWTPIGGN